MMSNKNLKRRLFLIEKSYCRELTNAEKKELKKLNALYKLEVYKRWIKMDFVIIVLGILYLCGIKVGTGLAICSIIEGLLIMINEIISIILKKNS